MSSSSPRITTTLMILLDAFSRVYLSRKSTPFLHRLSQEGVATRIEPLFAFKGIETTIFTGLWPNVHNVWTEFRLIGNRASRKKENFFRNLLIRTADCLYFDGPRAKLRYAIRRYLFRSSHRTPTLMPISAMAFFEPSQEKEIYEPGAIGKVGTVFDVFRKKRIRFVFIEPWIQGDKGVLSKAKRLINQRSRFQFWYLKFNDLDHLGHRFGPMPSMFEDELMKMDNYVEEIVSLLRERYDLNVLVLADHGMSRVHDSTDMFEEINSLAPRMYEDYVAFADSTMIRLWFFNDRAKQEICEHLHQLGSGHVLTDKEKIALKVPLDPKYGETVYALDEGRIVHPCFFHSRSLVRGMHGYAYPATREALPIMIVKGEIQDAIVTSEQITYADIARLILSACHAV